MKVLLTVALSLAVVIGLGVAGWLVLRPPQPPEIARAIPPRAKAPEPTKNPAPPIVKSDPAPDEQIHNASETTLPSRPVKAESPPKPAPAKKPKEPLHDPVARAAMALVGADPDAEAYWLEAIYDTTLPDAEREDLMEDLNEEGLSDTKQPGPQDLPLILNRLAIIGEIAPHADQFMLPHLAEAYKDLLNLAAITQGGGRPVR